MHEAVGKKYGIGTDSWECKDVEKYGELEPEEEIQKGRNRMRGTERERRRVCVCVCVRQCGPYDLINGTLPRSG